MTRSRSLKRRMKLIFKAWSCSLIIRLAFFSASQTQTLTEQVVSLLLRRRRGLKLKIAYRRFVK